jgi:hypothetical protein
MDPVLLSGVVIFSQPLIIGLICKLAFQRYPLPPIWLTIILWLLAIGCITYLFYLPCFVGIISFLLLAGIACNLVTGAEFLLRRLFQISAIKAFSIPFFMTLAAFLWFESRFFIIIKDQHGMPVEVDTYSLQLHHPPKGLFQEYQYGSVYQLKKGYYYFGVVQWLRYKAEWTFGSRVGAKQVMQPGEIDFMPAKWSEWPRRITILTDD